MNSIKRSRRTPNAIGAAFWVACAGSAVADHPSLSFGGAASGPIITPTPFTLPAGEWSAGVRFEYLDLEEIPDDRLIQLSEAHEHVHSVKTIRAGHLSVSYGVSDSFTVGVSLPYVERTSIREGAHHHGAPDTVDELGDSAGLGDLKLHGLYRITDRGNASTSALFGVEAPTGKDDEVARNGERFDAHLQPGSGSWDPFVGLVHSRPVGTGTLYGSVLYTVGTEGTRNTDFGDAVHYNLAFTMPLRRDTGRHDHLTHDDETHSAGDLIRWDLVLELNGEWRDKDEEDGTVDEHTGGNLLYVSPGLRVTFGKSLSAGLSVGIPVVEDLNGIQSEPNFRIIGSVGASF